MTIKIGIFSYGELTSLLNKIKFNFPKQVEFIIIDALLEEALEIAKTMEKENKVDVFVSGGGNAYILSKNLNAPFVEITITGFDFLLALKEACNYSNNIGIITYSEKLLYLDQVANTLKANIVELVYHNAKEIDEILNTLIKKGISTVIGGSLVNEKAIEKGMHCSFIYSEDGVKRAIDSAIKIAFAKKKEIEKAQQLSTILNFAYGGIIATDKEGIIRVFNPSAEKITGITSQKALGENISKILPNTRLNHVIKSKESELNQVQSVGNIKIITNRVPIVIKDEIIGAVATFQDIGTIQQAEEKIRQKLYKKGFVAKTKFEDIIGKDVSIRKTKNEAILYSKSDSTILIRGESGTGKELFAQSIHNESARAKRPFVAINCAALPPNLLESELFGYDEGAFTGAKKGGKQGVFELAHGGTIFLDEIGEIPLEIQARLLRVLEQREVLRVGGEKIIHVNIRVIAATNKDLWNMVKNGNFREDLYYRLNVLELHIPPLRMRKEDIPLLIVKFLKEYRKDIKDSMIQKIASNILFKKYDWPGNVRELKNIVERFSALYQGDQEVDNLIKTLMINKIESSYWNEKEKILDTLNEAGGNKSKAAQKLGISRTTLWRKMKEYNINI